MDEASQNNDEMVSLLFFVLYLLLRSLLAKDLRKKDVELPEEILYPWSKINSEGHIFNLRYNKRTLKVKRTEKTF